MRIIAGEHRGRRLLAPPGRTTRPMLDRVREALFSTLGDRVRGARILDLFAGSGSLGLESLSRGARSARMIERDARALEALKQNVETLNVSDRAQVVRGDALKPSMWDDDRTGAAAESYAVVFLDPPYALIDDPNARATLTAALDRLLAERLSTGGVLVLHAPARALELLRFRFKSPSDLRVYGGSALLYLEHRSTSVAESP